VIAGWVNGLHCVPDGYTQPIGVIDAPILRLPSTTSVATALTHAV